MKTLSINFSSKLRVAILSTLFCLLSSELSAQITFDRTLLNSYSEAGSTVNVYYYENYYFNGGLLAENFLSVEFNTGTYTCGLSTWTRPYELRVDGTLESSGSRDLNGGDKNISWTLLDPEPNRDYDINLIVTNSGLGTCGDTNNTVIDRTETIQVSGINNLSASYSTTTNSVTATWNKGLIKTDKYTAILSGQSIANPGDGFEQLESLTNISGTATSHEFTNLYPGITYKIEISQNVPGSHIVTDDYEFDRTLTTASRLSNLNASANSSNISVTWTNPSVSLPSASYIQVNRQRYDIGTSTVSESTKKLSDVGKNTTNPSSYTDNTEVSCHNHEYSLNLVFKKDDFEQVVHSLGTADVDFPSSLDNTPDLPSSFSATSLFLPTDCTTDVQLSWSSVPNEHDCQTYWFEIDRYQLSSGGSRLSATKTTVVSKTTSGIGSGPYSFEDSGSKIDGETYEYELKTGTTWPSNLGDFTSSSSLARSVVVGGSIEPYMGTITATIDPAVSLTISWDDIGNESGYVIKRKIGADIDKVFDATAENATSFTDGVIGDESAASCIDYTYELFAVNDCLPDGVSLGEIDMGTSTAGIVPLTFTADFSSTYNNGALLAYKGYERDFVFLEWTVAQNAGNLTRQRLYRREISNVGDSILIATLDPGARTYTDLEAGANLLYNYYLTAEADCGAVESISNTIQDVGFRTPWGLVNGHVDFVGGVDVEGAQIAAENQAALNLNKSMFFDGDRDYAILVDANNDASFKAFFPEASSTTFPFLFGTSSRTIEFWARPETYNGGSLFYIGNAGTNTQFGLQTPSTPASNNWVIELSSEQIAVDLTGLVAEGEWHHFGITYDGADISLYVDGQNLDALDQPMTWSRVLNTASTSFGKRLAIGAIHEGSGIFGSSYHGYIDEFRVWDYARTQAEIEKNKSGFLFGTESGLEIYLRMDENAGDFLYDASNENGTDFHRRHFSLSRRLVSNNVTFSGTIPAADQLGYNAITDQFGNYSIPYIRYRGAGELFNLVPFIFQHSFKPSNRNLFIGQSTPVHNEQDFEDISAFRVTGTVFYGREEDNGGGPETVQYCPAAGLFMAIDGTIALRDGLPVTTNEDGEFELSVPIGEHFVSVATSGHTYLVGRYPAAGTHDFQEEVLGLKFVDNTQMKVVGSVVGGTVEAAKPSGFGRTKNNIGVATIVFDGGCFSETVSTDSETGEYELNVFPLEYVVSGGANPLDQEQFVASDPTVTFPAEVEDLTFLNPLLEEADTLFAEDGSIVDIRELEYNVRKNYVHRVPHSLFVLEEEGEDEFEMGEPFITALSEGVQDTIQADQFNFPLFIQAEPYSARIKLTEVYTNSDNPADILTDIVGVTDAQITIANAIADENLAFELNTSSGDSLYTFFTGNPNILIDVDNPENGFLKRLEITSAIGSTSNTWILDGYVLGSRPDGTSFVTSGPEIVEHILRDPPGSNSSASITKESEFVSTYSWDAVGTLGAQADFVVSTGAQFSTGVGVAVDTDIKAATILSVEASVSIGGGRDYTETVSFSEDLSTSDDPLFVGPDADLFIGKSYNMNFGLADYVRAIPSDDCGGDQVCQGLEATADSGKKYQLGRASSFTMSPEGYDTYFIYTQRHIREQLIPDLERLRNDMLLNSLSYNSKLLPTHPNFGTNNDDLVWGDLASSPTPLKREVADFDGPSYAFVKDFAPDDVQVDSVRQFNEQIRIWKEALALNEQMKVQAINGQSLPNVGSVGELIGDSRDVSSETIENLLVQETGALESNVSFSSGAALTREVTLSNDVAYRFSWEVGLSTTLANVVEGKVNGTGVEVNHSVTLGATVGGASSRGESHSISYEFTLQDDDLGDFYSVDILDGGNQNGPIFKIQGGESGCPYEGVAVTNFFQPGTVLNPATVQHEKPAISITPANQVGIPSDEAAVYTLTLGNQNTTFGNEIEYNLFVDPASNPNGAILTVDGQNINRTYELGPGQVINRQVVLRKSPQQNEFKDIVLVFGSVCDENIREEVTLSASFIPTCSNSSIITPLNQWVVNNDFNNVLPITIGDYDINFAGLEKVTFRYKPSTSAQWIERVSLFNKEEAEGNELLISRTTPTTTYDWDISNLADGNYDLQTVAVCANGTIRESEIVSGIIDRVNPQLFGRPTPADGVLSPNDEISIRFNETIDAERIIKNLNFDVRAVLNGIPVRHFTSVGFDGDDNVTIPNLILNGSFTTEMWFKRSGTGSAESLFDYGDISIGINESDQVFMTDGTTVLTGVAAIPADEWTHLSVAYDDAGQANIYVNGSTDIVGAMNAESVTAQVEIGNSFTGNIHELRIWSDVRLLTEIRLSYLNTLSGNEINLAGYWPMDEGEGSFAADKTGRRPAILNAAWAFTQEARGVALTGNNDYFEIDGSTVGFDPEEDFTLSFWYKSDNAENAGIFSNGKVDGTEFDPQAWALFSGSTGDLALHSNGNIYPVTGEYLDGTWHHLALSVNRIGFVSLYIDGDVVLSIPAQDFSSFAGNKIYIGAYGRFEGTVERIDHYMQGAIDEVRIWNSARQEDQIKRDMRYRQSGDELGLFAYFPFEEYTEDEFGRLNLTATIEDLSDKTLSGLDEVSAALIGGAEFTPETTAINIERPVQQISFNYSINDDAIIITPAENNGSIENVAIDITVAGLFDTNGNTMPSPVTWTAFVDKNQVHWMNSRHEAVFSPDDVHEFTATIVNSGGEAKDYQLKDLPSWLTASPSSGRIDPLSTETVNFTVQKGLSLGEYIENILLSTDFGFDEVLQLKLNVAADAPDWAVNAEDYQYSMNIVGLVSINGVISNDTNDMVAAVIDGEIRGVANVDDKGNNRFVTFITIYSNSLDLQDISFRIWDADRGLATTASTAPAITFVNEAIHGSLNHPIIISSDNRVVLTYDFPAGWNWLSMPFSFEDNSIQSVLNNLLPSTDDVLKGQETFAQYDIELGWGGSLSGISGLEGYKIFLDSPSKFEVSGEPIPVSQAIPIDQGWNWVSYLPVSSQTINAALAGFNVSDGDIIKDRQNFAIYDGLTDRWVGTLNLLKPGGAYLLLANQSGELSYSNSTTNTRVKQNESEFIAASTRFQTNMNLIVTSEMAASGYKLAAYSSGDLRGRVAPIDGKYYLTVYGSDSEQLDFVYELGEINLPANQQLTYVPDGVMFITLDANEVTSLEDELTLNHFNVYPVPFNNYLNVAYYATKPGRLSVSIFSILGQKLEFIFDGEIAEGLHSLDHQSSLGKGVYLLILEFDGEQQIQRIVK
ncbi:MAG: LamG-like jellyroll fold domain-containing protein [Cyclobacteriaceae bacterium]